MITKLNPAALNEDWGGVLCLNLGSAKPDNFNEILAAFDSIIKDKKHYIISVFDAEDVKFMGDAELLVSNNGVDYVLLSNELLYQEGSHFGLKRFRYAFNRDGTYNRSINISKFASLKDYNSLKSQIDELKAKLNEITQTE